LFCATDGDAGKNSGVPVSSREELAQLRRRETLAAAKLLGIEHVEFGGYRDGALQQLDPAELTAAIVAFIRQTRPTIILTFGPEGAPTGHRDHQAVSRAATAAFFLSELRTAFPEQLERGLTPYRSRRLFYHAWNFPHRDPALRLESVPATVNVDVSAWREQKLAAFKAHETQQYGYERFVNDVLHPVELLAFAAGEPQPRGVVEDPFEGL
jgi:LmbE family N-acetylglucosaminyl deacetylase